jgi:3-oxoacyl-[acyl-carrier protein] reductase
MRGLSDKGVFISGGSSGLGYIVTPLSAAIDDQAFVEAYAHDYIPLKRVGRMDEVATAYAFLASDEASFVPGECLLVDGGQLAQ